MAFPAKSGTTARAGIDDPGLFPHRLSFDEGLVSFLPTNAAKLRAASFLDDRIDFATGPARLIPLRDVLDGAGQPPEPDRFIFHVSFCGSTLLSRLLDQPGRALVLREPQCLSDLAARRAMLDQSGAADPCVDAMIARLPALLARRWRDDEAIVVKPSNWINNLAPALCAGERKVLPLFLTMAPRAFLRAVLRGGPERIAFTARAAVHFSAAGHRNAEHVAAALGGTEDQSVQLTRLAALAFRMQSELFAAARAAGGWGEERCLAFEDLTASPADTACRAAELLELDLDPAIIAANVARWAGRDAKQPDAAYTAPARESEDAAIDDRFGALIDGALAWMEKL